MDNTLRQSGLANVEIRRINTTLLANLCADEDSLKQYRTQRHLRYSVSAIRNKQQGTTVVHVHFAADGSTLGAKVMPTEVSADLLKESLAASLFWRADVGGSSWERIPMKYELRKIKDLPDLQALQTGQQRQLSSDGKSVKAVPIDSGTN